MIGGKNFFDQPRNSSVKTYDNIRKIAPGQGDDYTTDCLLDYSYFNDYYKMIAIANKFLMQIRQQFNKLILQRI